MSILDFKAWLKKMGSRNRNLLAGSIWATYRWREQVGPTSHPALLLLVESPSLNSRWWSHKKSTVLIFRKLRDSAYTTSWSIHNTKIMFLYQPNPQKEKSLTLTPGWLWACFSCNSLIIVITHANKWEMKWDWSLVGYGHVKGGGGPKKIIYI